MLAQCCHTASSLWDASQTHASHNKHVESFEIIVPLVKTVNNLADFLSKPLLAPRYFELRDAIMNIKRGVRA